MGVCRTHRGLWGVVVFWGLWGVMGGGYGGYGEGYGVCGDVSVRGNGV
jgi:hypothetical protein